MLTIALAKGYLLKDTQKLFKKAGIEIADSELNSRKLKIFDKSKNFCFLLLRPADVPVYVEHGVADLGVTGRDVLIEGSFQVTKLLDLKYGRCKLVVAANKKDNYTKAKLAADLRVATKFINSADTYIKARGLAVELIKLYGSVELAPQGNLSDIIVDLVATGSTLKENGLEIIDTIYESTALLVANSIKMRAKYNDIIGLAKLIKAQI
jgi:ATP phosphoribosyltransferase